MLLRHFMFFLQARPDLDVYHLVKILGKEKRNEGDVPFSNLYPASIEFV